MELGINPVLWYSLVGVREWPQIAVMGPGSRPPGRTTVVTVSGRTWYGDDSPHQTPLEPAEGQARLVKTVNIQGGSAKATLDNTVGWVPSRGRQRLYLLLPYRQGIWRPDRYRLGHRPVICLARGTGKGSWVGGRTPQCLVPASTRQVASGRAGMAQCTVRPW